MANWKDKFDSNVYYNYSNFWLSGMTSSNISNTARSGRFDVINFIFFCKISMAVYSPEFPAFGNSSLDYTETSNGIWQLKAA